MQTTEQLLAERGKTHGDFMDNASMAQRLKRDMHSSDGWSNLLDAQQESLDLIATKISRILSGGNNNQDNWDDIAGYAKLANKSSVFDQPKQDFPPYTRDSLIHPEEGYLGRRVDNPSVGMTPPSPPVMKEVTEASES
jgi:hypothetical protein